MEALLKAIEDDDFPKAEELLKADPGVATRLVPQARLYESKIVHWLYAGDTALHLAAAGRRVRIVQLLLNAGADPNAANNHRRSGPLHYAADGYRDAEQQVETIRCLLEAGAEMNAQDKNGAAPLHRAVRTRSSAAVKFLLDAGADPLLKNNPGSTPFHLAVQNTGHGGTGSDAAKAEQRKIIEEFLSRGLKPTLKDAHGKSVLEAAQSDWIRGLLSQKA
jgi:ankyrin repeat protein